MGDLSGTWKVHIRFVRGEAKHSMQIEQQGGELQGRYRSQYGVRPLNGSLDNGQVRFRVPVHYQAVGTTYGFCGRLEGEVLRGEVDLGEYGRGQWEAQRV